jgi:hypothetical protein
MASMTAPMPTPTPAVIAHGELGSVQECVIGTDGAGGGQLVESGLCLGLKSCACPLEPGAPLSS